jgi:hypothetical protein
MHLVRSPLGASALPPAVLCAVLQGVHGKFEAILTALALATKVSVGNRLEAGWRQAARFHPSIRPNTLPRRLPLIFDPIPRLSPQERINMASSEVISVPYIDIQVSSPFVLLGLQRRALGRLWLIDSTRRSMTRWRCWMMWSRGRSCVRTSGSRG